MNRALPLAALLALGSTLPGVQAGASPALTFSQRIAAQEAIERFHFSHQIGAKGSFEASVPGSLLESKVRRYLADSVSLDREFAQPITAANLQAEMERIFRDTRLPGRLLELYHALGDDSFLFQECVARATLADHRLTALRRSQESVASYEVDPESVVAVANRIPRPPLGRGATEPSANSPDEATALTTCAADDTWDQGALADAPGPRSRHTAVWTGSLMILWGGVAGQGNTVNTGVRYDPVTDTWTRTSLVNAPEKRYDHTAVWTGSRMIVWGGSGLGTGGRYDPSTDTWTPTSTTNAPSGRSGHRAVWAGTRMIVWGGATDRTGGRYDPGTDTWTPTSTIGAPTGTFGFSAVWTGSRMMVWGGVVSGSGVTNTGALYDPGADSWSATPVSGQAPAARYAHASVWTGSEVLVWGGSLTSSQSPTNTGGRYKPSNNTWRTMDTGTGVPPARTDATAVWTGSEMIVWGGRGTTSTLASGGRYRPDLNAWVSMVPAPLAGRYQHSAIWDETRMVIFGGSSGSTYFADGDRYRPADDAWVSLPLGDAPYSANGESRVWTGDELIVWGGAYTYTPSIEYLDSGSRYDPTLDHWSRMSYPQPIARFHHSAVWTGSKMVVWGGSTSLGPTATGGLYDPLFDSWAPMTTVGAPAARELHTAVWSGRDMIVWGGTPTGGGTYLASGGRYDPQNDQWMPTSMAGAPSARYRHTAIWSGETMIVWGGWTGTQTNTGGQYDPRADRWTPTSFSFAPSARENHSAVWTGAEMVVWGGDVNPGPIQQSLKTGARYDPFEDSWIAIADAPQAMNGHSAVWTGTEMMVWTGSAGQRYDLAGNTWRSVSTLGAPTGPTAIVWAGDFVLAWGSAPRTGGRYAIDTDHDGTANQCDSDDDNDGAADGADCAPELASVAAPPGEVSGVLVSRSPGVHVAWNPQSGARYDIAAGLLETLRSTGGTFQASCGANSIAAVAWDDPSPAPSPGEGLFYLIRAENACGAASYGSASSGTQREVADDCP